MIGRLFKTGSCRKYEFFDILIQEILDNGWEDIASNKATDFMVFNSKGEDGNKNLLLQIRDWNVTNVETSSIRVTDYSSFGVRMPLGYEPEEHGVSGLFTRPDTTWNLAYIFPVSTNANGTSVYDKEVMLDYAISVNKDNIIYIITPPKSLKYESIVTFMGYPDETYVAESGNSGCIFASSFGGGYSQNDVLSIADNCMKTGISSLDISDRTVKSIIASKNPNADDIYILTDVVYEHEDEGIRGKIDSILFILNSDIRANDTVLYGEHRYKVAICHPQAITFTYNSFPSEAVAYRIE